MFFSKLIEKTYKNNVFSRQDADGSIFYFSADDFPGLNSEPFSFVNGKGNRLNGFVYSYDGAEEGRLVIFDHGMGAGHRSYMKEIEMIARHGYKVLSYDHTGCTNSEGDGIRGLSGSLADLDECLCAVLAEGKYKEENISVIGHSWGGFSAMNIPAFHPSLRSVIAISGFVSLEKMQKQLIGGLLSPFRKKAFEIEYNANGKYAFANAAEGLRKSGVPALIIHSSDDKTVSAKLHFEVLRNSLSDVDSIEFYLVNGKDHNPNYTVEAIEYKNAFFRDLKKKRKSGEISTMEQKNAFVSSYNWHKMTEQDEKIWQKIFDHLDKY